jgi:threonine aldolase
MRAAMAAAPVGDDQFGEDPTTNRLQERVATLLGTEAALWMPTGTMANQVALLMLTRPGDDVVVGRASHAVWSETGAAAANAGVQFTEVGTSGTFTAEDFLAARKPRGHMLLPPTTLVQIENTQNRGGGLVFPQSEVERICGAAREREVASFLDGARLWNAAAATGIEPAVLAAPFDVVSVAFSKGLGAPGGSVLAGPRALMPQAQRARRRLGGAMRQNGIFSAAALYALDHHLPRLAADHANARSMATRLAASSSLRIDLDTVQTNIVMVHLAQDGPTAEAFVELARERGVLVVAFGPKTVRLVTHFDVTSEQCDEAAEILASLVRAA